MPGVTSPSCPVPAAPPSFPSGSVLFPGGGWWPLGLAGPLTPPSAPTVRPLGLVAGLAGHHHPGLPESLPQLPPGGPAGQTGPREGAAAGQAGPPCRLPGREERRHLGPAPDAPSRAHGLPWGRGRGSARPPATCMPPLGTACTERPPHQAPRSQPERRGSRRGWEGLPQVPRGGNGPVPVSAWRDALRPAGWLWSPCSPGLGWMPSA